MFSSFGKGRNVLFFSCCALGLLSNAGETGGSYVAVPWADAGCLGGADAVKHPLTLAEWSV